MKIQSKRKMFIIFSFLLFPITIYYFSPYLIVEGLAKGIITGSFVVFLSMIFVSIFTKRAFCGWACPGSGLSLIFSSVNNKPIKNKKIDLVKYIIWLIWILTLILVAINYTKPYKIDFFFQTKYGISVADPYGYIVYYGVVLLIGVLSLSLGRRGFCHSACWMAPFMVIGSKIGETLKIPSLKLISHKDKCISCKWCNKNCPMSLDVEQMVKNNKMNNIECILCGECVDTCPKSVINYSVKNTKRIKKANK